MRAFRYLLLIAAFAVVWVVVAAQPADAEPEPQPTVTYHAVDDQTPGEIALECDGNSDEILALNGVSDETQLRAGPITIRRPTGVHHVRAGETWSELVQCGFSDAELRTANPHIRDTNVIGTGGSVDFIHWPTPHPASPPATESTTTTTDTTATTTTTTTTTTGAVPPGPDEPAPAPMPSLGELVRGGGRWLDEGFHGFGLATRHPWVRGAIGVGFAAFLAAIWALGRRAQRGLTQSAHRTRYERWVVRGCALTVLITTVDMLIVQVAGPTLNAELGFSQEALVWVVQCYVLPYAGLMGLASVVIRRFGEKPVLVVGLGLFACGAAICMVATDVGPLGVSGVMNVGRIAQGIGGAPMTVVSLSLLHREFKHDKDKVDGAALKWTASSLVGIPLGVLMGGALLNWFTWRWTFAVLVALPVAVIVAMAAVLPRETRREHEPVDWRGGFLSVAVLALLNLGLFTVEDRTQLDTGVALLLGAVAAAAVLVRWERKVREAGRRPAFDFAVFRGSKAFTAACLLYATLWGTLSGPAFNIGLYLQIARRFGELKTGLLVACLFTVIPGAFIAKLFKGVDRRIVVAGCGFIVLAGAYGMGSQFDLNTSDRVIAATFALAGLGIGPALASVNAIMFAHIPPNRGDEAAGLNRAAGGVGNQMGLAIMALIVALSFNPTFPDGLDGQEEYRAEHGFADAAIVAREHGAEQFDPLGLGIWEAARQAYLPAMETAVLVAAGAAVAGALVCFAWRVRRRSGHAIDAE